MSLKMLFRRAAALTVAATLVMSLSTVVLAQEEGGGEGPATTAAQEGGDAATTTAAEGGGEESGYTPAVTVAPEPETESLPPWTARYLVPTGLVLAALAVFVTVVQYFLRVVRNRYKVIE